MEIWIEFLVIFVFILFNAFFAASEISIISVRSSRIKDLIEKGITRAKIVEKLKTETDTFLATVQVGMTVVSSFASAFGGTVAVQHLKNPIENLQIPIISQNAEIVGLIFVVLFVSYLSLVIGELVPKSLALRYAEQISVFVAPIILFFSKIFSLPVKSLVNSSNFILKPFKDKTSFSESKISEEEFKIMLDEGKKTGVIDKTEHELISSIFEFTDTMVKEIMVPRTDITAIDCSISSENLFSTISEEGYSRIPVYKKNLDNIIGIIYAKDVVSLLEYRNLIILDDIIRQPYFVPQTKKISELLKEMQRKKIHIAIVNDEYGGTAGIVTLEDIIEEIVGEIQDEYDEELKEIESSSDGSFLISGKLSISNFNEKFNSAIPEDNGYETITTPSPAFWIFCTSASPRRWMCAHCSTSTSAAKCRCPSLTPAFKSRINLSSATVWTWTSTGAICHLWQ